MRSYARISAPENDAYVGNTTPYENNDYNDTELSVISKPDQESHEPAIPPKPPKTKNPAWKRWQAALGVRSIAIILIGFSVIIASSAILLYLWIATRNVLAGKDPPSFWRAIVDRKAAPQVVTICAAAIRTSITFQLGVVTAALAAVTIETSGTSLANAAAVSIKRAYGEGAHELITAGGIREACSRRRLGQSLLAAFTVVMLIVTTLLSTILLSDFEDSDIPAPPTQMDIPILVSNTYSAFDFSGRQWQSMPIAAWRFAVSDRTDDDDRDAAHDTGDTILAALPFADAHSRTSLMQYEGPATVSSTRTYCYAPKGGLSDLRVSGLQTLNGTLTLRPVLRDLQYPSTKIPFHCHITRVEYGPAWPIFICPTGIFRVDGNPDYGKYEFGLMPFIVINLTDSSTEKFSQPPYLDAIEAHTADDDGVWISLSIRNDTQHSLKVSVCLSNMGYALRNVSMKGASFLREPTPTWDLGHPGETDRPSSGWNTESLSSQMAGLGSDGLPQSLEKRQLLHLDVKNMDGLRFQDIGGRVSDFYSAIPGSGYDWSGFAMVNDSSDRLSFGGYAPHGVYVSEFQDILLRTGLLPLAMQSFLARLWQTYYYNNFQEDETTYNITAVFATSTLLPTKWTGLTIVLAIIAGHFALVIFTVCLFLKKTEASALWDPWQAVAQVVSPATRDKLDVVGGMDSREARKIMEQGDARSGMYRVSYSEAAGRHQLELAGIQRRVWRRSSSD